MCAYCWLREKQISIKKHYKYYRFQYIILYSTIYKFHSSCYGSFLTQNKHIRVCLNKFRITFLFYPHPISFTNTHTKFHLYEYSIQFQYHRYISHLYRMQLEATIYSFTYELFNFNSKHLSSIPIVCSTLEYFEWKTLR